jgi:hypothetical protein
MARSHIPDLDALDRLSDQQSRFYAAIGVVVSLAAAIELTVFDIFKKALALDNKAAGALLFKIRNVTVQRDKAIEAMNSKLAGSPLFASWTSLAERLVVTTGKGGLRHLIAHNAVQREYHGGGFMSGPLMSGPFMETREDFLVYQDRQKVIAGVQTAQQANYDSLRAYAETVIALRNDIGDFLAEI